MSTIALRQILSTRSALSRYSSVQSPSLCGAFRYQKYSTAGGNDDMKTVVRTYEKFFRLPEGYSGKISRHNFKQFSVDFENGADKIEAFFINSVLMKWAELYGLDKFPEEGGKEVTLVQLYEKLRSMPKETAAFYGKAVHRALFRAIDTNNNGVISRDEWANHLKLLNAYESDEHARSSFDDLDTNKDGVISMAEFENQGSSFWVGADDKVQDFYGTSSLK